jgi:hypothetical protein
LPDTGKNFHSIQTLSENHVGDSRLLTEMLY